MKTTHITVVVALVALLGIGCGQSPTAPSAEIVGTWTPVLGGSLGTSGQAYSSQHGEYVKNGSLVFVSATITLLAKGDIVGHLEIQGLPFPTAPDHDSACVFGDFDEAATPQVWVAGILGSGVRVVTLRHKDSPSGDMSMMDTTDLTDTTALEMACTYITAI